MMTEWSQYLSIKHCAQTAPIAAHVAGKVTFFRKTGLRFFAVSSLCDYTKCIYRHVGSGIHTAAG